MASNSQFKASTSTPMNPLEPNTSTLDSPSEPTRPTPAGRSGPSDATTVKQTPSLDDIITLLDVGSGTFYYFFAVAFFGVTTVCNALSTQFIAPSLDYTCSQPQGWPTQGSQCELPNMTITNSSIGNVHPYSKATMQSPLDTSTSHQSLHSGYSQFDKQNSLTKVSSVKQSQATHYPSSAAMVSCEQFSYQADVFQSTLTSDFDLVCSRAWIRPLFQLAFTAGCSVGAVLCAAMSNRFGRQTVVWWSSFCTCVFVVVVGTVQEIIAVTIARFLIGVLSPFIVCTSFTLGLEVCPKKHRVVYSSLVALPYALTLLLLTAVAYGSREWRVVQLVGLIGCLSQCTFLSPCFLVESPLWLVSEGRLVEAEANIRNIARKNNRSYDLPDDLAEVLAVNYERQVKLEASVHTPGPGSMLLSLISTAAMRRVTFTTLTASFALGVLYMAIPLRAGEFSSPFLYATFMGICEIPGYACFGYIVNWCGTRRASLGCCVILALIEGVLMTMEVLECDYEMTQLVLSGLAFFLLISHYQVNFSQCSSLFPTHVRSLGSSAAYLFCTLGWNVPALIDLILPHQPSWVPLLLNTCLATLCGVLVVLMPDTTHAPLYQTVNEYVQAVEDKRRDAGKKSLLRTGKDSATSEMALKF